MVINYDNYQFVPQHLQILSERWFYRIYNELLLIILTHISSILKTLIYSYVLFTFDEFDLLSKYWRKSSVIVQSLIFEAEISEFFLWTLTTFFTL